MRLLELQVQDVELVEAELRTLCARSGAAAVVLVDMSGVVLASHRVPDKIDHLLFAALLSSNFAATEELSRHLGVSDFKVMYHEGKKQNLYFNKVGADSVLIVLFRDSNALGRVRLFCEKSVPELAKLVGALVKHGDGKNMPEQGRLAARYLRRITDTAKLKEE